MADENTGKLDETEIFGRKIFFLNPTFSIRNDVIPSLQGKEYEVYVIDSYKDAKNILKSHRKSICFINVDAQLTMGAWFNFIKSFEEDEVLKTTFVGLISERLKGEDRSTFLNQASIPGGIISSEEPTTQITEEVEKLLETNHAKGKRQYVRASLAAEREANMFWMNGDKLIQMKLVDISSVGMSAFIPEAMAGLAHEKSILRNITLRLGPKQFVIDTVVLATKTCQGGALWIMLMLQNTPDHIRNTIRDFVSETNQKLMILSIEDKPSDKTDYNGLPYYKTVSKRSKPSS
ncbi:MAG: hypothetical protein J5780_01440 [Treponema sp.]|nr:hypothetical protein [Treponema sp.]